MNITTIGIDLAKTSFQVHCVDKHGKQVLNKKLKREQVVPFFSNRPVCLIGMEACGSAHYWANKLQALGHTVKLMAPQFVKPCVKTNKNDAADSEYRGQVIPAPLSAKPVRIFRLFVPIFRNPFRFTLSRVINFSQEVQSNN